MVPAAERAPRPRAAALPGIAPDPPGRKRGQSQPKFLGGSGPSGCSEPAPYRDPAGGGGGVPAWAPPQEGASRRPGAKELEKGEGLRSQRPRPPLGAHFPGRQPEA